MSASDDSLARVIDRLDALGACTDTPGRITRLAFSPALRRAHDLALGWMREAGMGARRDAAGNLVGRYEGAAPGARAVMLGSHLDTVHDGGAYDGALGVVAAIEVVARLRAAGTRLAHALEVVSFADEEGVRFDGTVLGSAALAGVLPEGWETRHDADGVSAAEAVAAFGLDPARVGEASRVADPPAAYIELHIEQGPELELLGRPLGAVTAIAGATRLAIALTGQAGHAGTVPMAARRDALAAAAECVLAVERICAGPGAVGTVGRIQVAPNASNVIPGRARFSLDLRSGDDALHEALLAELLDAFTAIAARRGLRLGIERGSETRATRCDPGLVEAIADAIGEGAPRLASGAGHDGISMSRLGPVGMIFVRCAGGISHSPLESVAPEDIRAGIEALHDLVRARF